MQGNALVGQSGGPTSVINASLSGVIKGCLAAADIETVYGMRFGIEGFMEEKVIDLGALDAETIQRLGASPGSALGSCRHKVQEEDFPRILELLEKYNIRYIFLIGGNDTMDTIHRVETRCAEKGYALIGIGVPKTVDNDLFGTDHTPGFPSAARYVALSVLQSGVLARDMQRVDQFVVFQTVGRESGWLPAAAALARRRDDEAPHIILMPERPFERAKFLDAVRDCHERNGWVSIVCGEGIVDAQGRPVSASETEDKFANIEFGAMGGASAAMQLHRMISDTFGWRGEFQVTESLQMCAADRASVQDLEEAEACGARAVQLAAQGKTGVMVSIERASNAPYKWTLGEAPLHDVAVRAKPMPDEFIAENGMHVTPACLDYLRPLVGELPDYARLA